MPIFISTSSQRGVSSLEHTIIALLFLLLALATYESAHWLLLRQTLNTALLDTARIAATQQAHPQIIDEAFEQRLQKLTNFSFNSNHKNWHIERIATVPPDSSNTAGTTNTRHDYQALQYLQGNSTVFAANTLHLRLHYLHLPATPLIRQLIANLLQWSDSPYQNQYAQGYVPITTEVQLAMQSDQQNWTYKPNKPLFPTLEPPIDHNTTAPTTSPTPDPITEPTPAPLPPWQPPLADAAGTVEPGCDGLSCCAPV